MGLFGKKDPCALCGGKVKGIFPSRIEGQLVCSTCYGTVDLPDGMMERMTLTGFRGYMAFREENDRLRQRFQTTQQVDFGWLDDKLLFDMSNKLLCMDKRLNKTIFEGRQIKSFVIREDTTPLFEGDASGLRRYVSAVPDRIMALAPQVEQFNARVQMQRSLEHLADRLDDDRGNDRNRTHHTLYFNITNPVENFYVEIRFDHPYWNVFTADMGGPTFNSTMPDVNDYLRDYNNSTDTMEKLAQALMDVAFPGAPVQVIDPNQPVTVSSAAPAPAAAVDVATELQRFKALMDQGILTEEEFIAKKRQLLGI